MLFVSWTLDLGHIQGEQRSPNLRASIPIVRLLLARASTGTVPKSSPTYAVLVKGLTRIWRS